MIALKIDIDPNKVFDRQLTELEKSQIPFAMAQTINGLAFRIRDGWKGAIRAEFKNPRTFTVNAPLVTKATKSNLTGVVFMRDQAAGGIAPAKYLLAQVFGGEARLKRSEKALTALGLLPDGMRVAPGRGARLDASGDISGRQFKGIISGLKDKSSGYFAITDRAKSHLKPGVFQRKGTRRKRNIRSILNFIPAPKYNKRLQLFEIARKVQQRNAQALFSKELDRAVKSTFSKAFK